MWIFVIDRGSLIAIRGFIAMAVDDDQVPITPKKKGYGPKFTEDEMPKVLERVAELDALGFSQWDIARDLGVSQPSVSGYLRKIVEEYKASRIEERRVWVFKEIKVLLWMRKEAVQAWEESKKSARKRVTKLIPPRTCYKCKGDGAASSPGKKGGKCPVCLGKKILAMPPEVTKTVEGRLPEAGYLAVIAQTDRAIRDLMGLDEATKLDINMKTVDWTALLQEALGGQNPEDIMKEVDADTFKDIPLVLEQPHEVRTP
jgi:predicted transcriptional regulator